MVSTAKVKVKGQRAKVEGRHGTSTVGALVIIVIVAAPASAQVDLTGTWQRVGSSDNGAAREPVDLLGMPLSADGRAKALSYDIAALSATERQCQMYPPIYAIVGPFPLQFVMVPDPVTQKLLAWKILGWGDRDETVIWMDGRPHPSKYAPHSHGGFTTGAWEGDTLTAVTTHAKLGDIKRHRGFSSDRATLTYRFNRHGDLLTVTGILEDPVYLAEPYVLTEVFRLTTNPNNFPLTACEPIEELPSLHENPALVPHYLPGKHPAMNEVTERYNIPLEAVVGGPETMYPEYRKKLKDKYVMPPPCKEGCGVRPQLRRRPPQDEARLRLQAAAPALRPPAAAPRRRNRRGGSVDPPDISNPTRMFASARGFELRASLARGARACFAVRTGGTTWPSGVDHCLACALRARLGPVWSAPLFPTTRSSARSAPAEWVSSIWRSTNA